MSYGMKMTPFSLLKKLWAKTPKSTDAELNAGLGKTRIYTLSQFPTYLAPEPMIYNCANPGCPYHHVESEESFIEGIQVLEGHDVDFWEDLDEDAIPEGVSFETTRIDFFLYKRRENSFYLCTNCHYFAQFILAG